MKLKEKYDEAEHVADKWMEKLVTSPWTALFLAAAAIGTVIIVLVLAN